MRTMCARPGLCRDPFGRARDRHRAAAIILLGIAGSLLAAGCAATETRYTAKQLPLELQGRPWQAPCTVDLSPSVAERRSPKFESGDEVEVLVAVGINSSQMTRIRTTVAGDGTIELPVLGRIPVAGVTSEASHQAVVQACYREGVSQTPLVQVTLQKPRQHRIVVNGAVGHPGIYTLPRQSSDLVSALAAAGGLSRDAGAKIVILSRSGAKGEEPHGADIVRTSGLADEMDAPPLMKASDPAGERREIRLTPASKGQLASEQLKDGDVVTVERSDPPSIVVTGMVNRPGRYTLPIGEEFRILDAVASAHGVSYKVLDHLMVCRKVPGREERAVIEINLREATRNQTENLLLMPGDIVSVEANAPVLFQDCVDYIGSAILGVAPAVIR
jgi:polysaccharide export outer membrane protein